VPEQLRLTLSGKRDDLGSGQREADASLWRETVFTRLSRAPSHNYSLILFSFPGRRHPIS